MYKLIELPISDNNFTATFVNTENPADIQKLHRREYSGIFKIGDEVNLTSIKKSHIS